VKNERTGKPTSKTAGRLLVRTYTLKLKSSDVLLVGGLPFCTVSELRSVCASALTQTPDKAHAKNGPAPKK